MNRRLLAAGFLLLLCSRALAGTADDFTERTEWVMGTALRIVLPADFAGGDAVFSACFAEARRWDALLSPWRPDAPLTRLSAAAGEWVVMPADVLHYLERAVRDAERTGHVFDITLVWQGSTRLEIDREASRARLPAGLEPLDPGGDGKGVALDAMVAILDKSGVTDALVDFGGSSFLARGDGPQSEGWPLALLGPAGETVGVLILADAALSVSSTVQRDHHADGSLLERHHLRNLRNGAPVTARRTVAVIGPSAVDTEVLSTAVAIAGVVSPTLKAAFPDCAVGIFGENGPLVPPDEAFTASFRGGSGR